MTNRIHESAAENAPEAATGGAEPMPVYVLAGGQSRRFGSNKARAILRDRPIIAHVVAHSAPVRSPVVIVGREPGEFQDLGWRTIADRVPGRGPLGGLHAALSDAIAQFPQAPGIILAPCDTLGFQADWLAPLARAVEGGALAAAYFEPPWVPLFAAYSCASLPAVNDALQGTDQSLQRLLSNLNAEPFPIPAGWEAILRCDTMDALAAAAHTITTRT